MAKTKKPLILGDIEVLKEISENGININGFSGTEKVYYDDFSDKSESSEDEPIYKSEIKIAGKTFDIFVKYNQGRKSTTPLHLIIKIDDKRITLGFFQNKSAVFQKINDFITYTINRNR